MAKRTIGRNRGGASASSKKRGLTRKADELNADRISRLEEAIEQLLHREFYAAYPVVDGELEFAAVAAQDRYVRAMSDGWLVVMAGGTKKSLPSGLKIALTQTSSGRDYGVVSEGILEGMSFDVGVGYIESAYRRIEGLVINVVKRSAGPVIVDGTSYDLELSATFKEGGAAKSIGPFLAKTHAGNPLPAGRHDVEIADFPHQLGSVYGRFATVWFRIGHTGDRYLHPGRISEGCITCVPSSWPAIYDIVHAARIDKKSVGHLVFSP